MKTETSETKQHAKYSASGSSRWMNCAGSIAISENAPPQREKEYAIEGTEAHACLELLLKNRNKLESAMKMAQKKYPKEMCDHVFGSAHWIISELSASPGAEFLCETRVDASPFTTDGQFGTLDAAIVREFGKLTVIDFKYGAGIVVDPDENSQLIYYALGISHQYHHNFSEVELVVIQPRAYHESGETTRTWTCSMEELLTWIPKFKNAVKATIDPFAPLATGTWCKFCPAATICPEIKNRAMERAQVAFDDVDGIQSVPEPKGIAIKNLPTILKATYALEAWISKVQEHAFHVLERGGQIDGYKLVEKKCIRKWTDENEVAKKAQKLFGPSAFSVPELLSPAQFEKALGGETGAETFLDKNVVKKSSGLTLVPEHDKRPEVRTIESTFTALNDEGKEEIQMATKKKSTKKKTAKKKAAK